MKRHLIITLFLIPGAILRAALPTMPSDTYNRCMSELAAALKTGNMEAVARNAENLKKYGLQADGQRLIKEAQARNKDMFAQVKESYGYFAELREAAGANSLRACERLITNLEKKCMSDAMWELVPVFGQVKQVYDSLKEMTPHGDAPVIKENALSIAKYDQMRKYCDDIIKSFGTILTELKDEKTRLTEAEDVFKEAAARTMTVQVKTEKKEKPAPPEKQPQPPEQESPPKTAETPAAPVKPATGGDTEITIEKGYVVNSDGKITMTETLDKDGNVIRTTNTTTDADGKVVEVHIYGSDGALMSDPKAAAAAQEMSKEARETAKNAAREAVRSAARPPRPPTSSGRGGCTCP